MSLYAWSLSMAAWASIVLSGPVEAGEAFLKGGFDLRPNDASDYDFVDGWLVSVGYSWEAAEHVWLEAEAQTSYQSYRLGGHVQLRAIPLNGFFNVRLDFPGSGPYGGGGVGYLSEIAWGTVELFPDTFDFSEYQKDLGVHLFGGVNVGKGILVEYMAQKALEVGSLYDSRWRHFVLAGIRW